MEDIQAGLLFALLGNILFLGPLVGGLSMKRTMTTERMIPWILALISISILTGLSCIVYSVYLIPDSAYSLGILQPMEAGFRTGHYRLKPWLSAASFSLMFVWFTTVAIAVGNLVDALPPARAALAQLATTMTFAIGQIWAFFNSYDGYLVAASMCNRLATNSSSAQASSLVAAIMPYAYPVIVSAALGGLCIRKTTGQSKLLSSSLHLFFWSILIASLLALCEATIHLETMQGVPSSMLMLKASRSGISGGSTTMDYSMDIIDKVLLSVSGLSYVVMVICFAKENTKEPQIGGESCHTDIEKQTRGCDDTVDEKVPNAEGSSTNGKAQWRRRTNCAFVCCLSSVWLFGISMIFWPPAAFQATLREDDSARLLQPGDQHTPGQWAGFVVFAIVRLLVAGSVTLVALLHLRLSTPSLNQDAESRADEQSINSGDTEQPAEEEYLLNSETNRTYGTWAEYGELSSPLDLHMPIW